MEKEMLKPADHFHGSDLEKIEQFYGISKKDIVSFGANVNPLGISGLLKEKLSDRLDAISTYPDREYKKLRQSIGNYCHTDSRNIIPGNGSTELISLIIRLRRPRKALILGPTYSEYEREIRMAGGTCQYFPLKESDNFIINEEALIDRLGEDIDMLVLCNPNNPTSSAVTALQMEAIVKVCLKFNIFVMIDETYAEFAQDCEKITAIPLTRQYQNIVVLRGVSKFFASPGLRLGYGVTGNAALLEELAGKQNPWTVSSLADEAGQLLFSDVNYIRQTKELIDSQRTYIVESLTSMDGIKVYPPHANFILVRLTNGLTAHQLFETAIRQGLMIRDCSDFPFLDDTYFRFCFMMPSDNDRLLACIRKFLHL